MSDIPKLLIDIKYELQRQAFGAPVDKPRLVALIERIESACRYVPSAPTGWKLVPIQPTEAMVLAGIEAAYESVDGTRGVIRNAILAAPEYRCEPQL